MAGGSDTRQLSAAEFWDFSLQLYGQPGVEKACIELQDKHGADVNTLLICCYAGSLGIVLGKTEFNHLRQAVSDWLSSVLNPLRKVRRTMKPFAGQVKGGQTLYKKIFSVELDAEKISQNLLVAALTNTVPIRPYTDQTEKNLTHYLAFIGASSTAAESGSIITQAAISLKTDQKPGQK